MSEHTSPSGATRDEPFHVMTMPIGPACNLECEYCYYLDKTDLYPEQADFRMDAETLEEFVKQYIEAQPGPQVTFAWQGGEPTLRGLDFYRDVVRLQNKNTPPGKQIVNTLQTNGTQLDDEWCRFLADNDFLVGISIDGPEELHNRYRQTRGGGPIFEEVMNGLALLKKHNVEHNVLCVVNAVNSHHPLRVYDFFKDQHIDWIQFIPLVEPVDTPGTTPDDTTADDANTDDARPDTDHQIPEWVRDRGGVVTQHDDDYQAVVNAARVAPVTDRSVDPKAYADFMCTIFDEWVRNDVGTISVRLFDQCLQNAIRGEAGYCILSETCGNQVAMEHNGDLYACDHFVEPGFHLGNIHDTHLTEMLDSDEQRQFGEYKRDGLPSRCRECNVRVFCHGACPRNRHLQTPGGELGLNYLCAGYRKIFTYVQPYLDIFEQTITKNQPLPVAMKKVAILDDQATTS